MWYSCPSPFCNSPLMSASPQIGISYGSPEFVGEKDQTDNLSSCWGFLGSSSICIPQECCCSICLCLQTPQQCPMQDSATSHCLSNTAKGKIEVSRWPPQCSFSNRQLWCGSAKLLMGTQIHLFPHPAVLQLLFFILGCRNISLWSESGSKRGCKELFQVQHGAIPLGCCLKVSEWQHHEFWEPSLSLWLSLHSSGLSWNQLTYLSAIHDQQEMKADHSPSSVFWAKDFKLVLSLRDWVE